MKLSLFYIASLLTLALAAPAPIDEVNPQLQPDVPTLTFYCFNDRAGTNYCVYCQPDAKICPLGAKGCPFVCGK